MKLSDRLREIAFQRSSNNDAGDLVAAADALDFVYDQMQFALTEASGQLASSIISNSPEEALLIASKTSEPHSMNTMQQLAQEALDIQDACNLIAVVNGMSRAIDNLRELGVRDTELCSHPITGLWADKISSLCCTQCDNVNSKHTKCYELARAPVSFHESVVCSKDGYETLDEADSARNGFEEYNAVGGIGVVLSDGRYYVVYGSDYLGGHPGPYL